MLTKKTKIICTMGPATDDDEVLKDLMRSGMDIARLNFSHGDHEEQLGRIKRIKKFREELNLPIAILLDTKGPEIRTGFNSSKLYNRGDILAITKPTAYNKTMILGRFGIAYLPNFSSSLLSHIKNLSYHQKLKHIFLSKDISSKDRKDQGYDHKDQKSMC